MRAGFRVVLACMVLGLLAILAGENMGILVVEPLYSAHSCALHVGGRDYLSSTACGEGGADLCWSQRELQSFGDWPPGRAVPLLSFSGVHSISVRPAHSGVSPTAVFV